MLTGKNIIYFANDWNAEHKTSSHHIAKELLKYNRIIYVETGGLRIPKEAGKWVKRVLLRLFSWFKGVRKINDNLYIYSLIIFPFYNKVCRFLNIYFNVFLLRRAMRRYHFLPAILWFIPPHVSYLADYLDKYLTIYYCTDAFSGMRGTNPEAIEKLEDSLLRKADIVFATSEYLYNRLKDKNINPNIFYSPHAVDVARFSKAQDENLEIASDIKNLRKPIIGYIGFIEYYFDWDMIVYIAEARPEWSIVLIGGIGINAKIERIPSNVRYLGFKKYKDIPSYLKGFDVCIIPFKIDELIRASNPIKLKEYLAAGKPVVATRLPEIEKFKDLVKIADSYQDFVEEIEYLYKNDNAEKIKARIEAVKIDTWYNRVEAISQVIEKMKGI